MFWDIQLELKYCDKNNEDKDIYKNFLKKPWVLLLF